MMTRSRTAAAIAVGMFSVALASGLALDGATAAGGWVPASRYDDDIADARAKQDQLNAQMERLESELEDTDAAIVEAGERLREIEGQLPAAQAAVDEANDKYDEAVVQQQLTADKLAAAEAQDQAITDQISTDEGRISELKEIVAQLARAAYQGVGDEQALGLVFNSSTSQEFIDQFAAEHNASRVQSNALADVEEIAAVNRNRGARQAAVRDYIVELKAEADRLVEETARLKAEAEEKKAELDALLAQQQEVKAELERQREAAIEKQQALAAKQAQVRDDIMQLVQKKIAEEEARRKAEEARRRAEEEARRKAEEEARRKAEQEAAAGAGGSSSSGGSSGGSSSGGSSSGGSTAAPADSLTRGALGWPVRSRYVTSRYGMRFHPILHYWRLHAGTDMRAYCGDPLYAARSGTVQWAKGVPGLGNQVLIDHGFVSGKSLMTSYNHMSGFSVRSGQHVSKGQLLGYSGNTGTSAACHLHFETYVNGATIDPMTLVG